MIRTPFRTPWYLRRTRPALVIGTAVMSGILLVTADSHGLTAAKDAAADNKTPAAADTVVLTAPAVKRGWGPEQVLGRPDKQGGRYPPD